MRVNNEKTSSLQYFSGLSNNTLKTQSGINKNLISSTSNSSNKFININCLEYESNSDSDSDSDSDYIDINKIINYTKNNNNVHTIGSYNKKPILENSEYPIEGKKIQEKLLNRKINDIKLINLNNDSISIEMYNKSTLPCLFIKNEEGEYIDCNKEKNTTLLSSYKINNKDNKLFIKFENKLDEKIVPSVIIEDMIDGSEYFKLIRDNNNSSSMCNIKNITIRVPDLIICIKENDKGDIALFIDKDINKENDKYFNKLDGVLTIKRDNLTIEFVENDELLNKNESSLLDDYNKIKLLRLNENKEKELKEINNKLIISDEIFKFISNKFIFESDDKMKFKEGLLTSIENIILSKLISSDNPNDYKTIFINKFIQSYIDLYNINKKKSHSIYLSKKHSDIIVEYISSSTFFSLSKEKSDLKNIMDEINEKEELDLKDMMDEINEKERLVNKIADLIINQDKNKIKDKLIIEMEKHSMSELIRFNKDRSRIFLTDIVIECFDSNFNKKIMKKIDDKKEFNDKIIDIINTFLD